MSRRDDPGKGAPVSVVLINPRPTGRGLNEATIEPPLGLGYLAAVLEQQGVPVKIIDAQVLRLNDDEVLCRIPEDTLLIGISVNSFTVEAARRLIVGIRSRSAALIILGGPYPTALPEVALTGLGSDGVIRGEGEYSLAAIARNLTASHLPFSGAISGLVYKTPDGEVVSNPVERIGNLDSLPFPAYHLMPLLKHYSSRSRKRPVAAIVTSRGCSFSCTFCSKDVFQQRVTFRSAENVLQEIDHLVHSFGVRQLDILDDNVAQNRERLEAIINGIIERRYNLAINLQTGIRTELLNEPLLLKMKQAGVFKLAFGVETGDADLLRRHRKELNLGRVRETVLLAKRHGFLVYGFFVIGLPGETDSSFRKTLEFARSADFDLANFSMAVPFPGTELYTMVQERGRFLCDMMQNIDRGFYGGEAFFEYGGSSAAESEQRYRAAYREFYNMRQLARLMRKGWTLGEMLWTLRASLSLLRPLLRRGAHGR